MFPANPAMAFALVGMLGAADRTLVADGVAAGRFRWRLAGSVVLCLASVVVALGWVAQREYVRGQEFARAGHWSEAAAAYGRAARWNPLQARYPATQATALMQLRPLDRDAAAMAARRAMTLDRMNAAHPLQLARLIMHSPRLEERQFQEAEALLRRALALDPFNRPAAYRELAGLYERWGRSADAARVYADGVARYLGQGLGRNSIIYMQLWPEIISLALDAADFFLQRGDAPGAERIWRNLLAEDPGVISAALQLNELYTRAGRLTDARAVLLAALARVPTNEQLRDALQVLGP